jgi:hypothetical protein
MSIHLVNPSDTSFATAVITPRWLYVLAAATAKSFGDPEICDETLEHLNLERIQLTVQAETAQSSGILVSGNLPGCLPSDSRTHHDVLHRTY